MLTTTAVLSILSLAIIHNQANSLLLNPSIKRHGGVVIAHRHQMTLSTMPSSKIDTHCSRSHTPSVTRQWAVTPSATNYDLHPEDEEYQDYYKTSAWSFGLLLVLLFLMPDRTLSKQLASKMGGASGFGLAAFVFYLLSKSSQYDQGNDYVSFQKRCQLGLVGFCGLGLLSFPGEASFWPSAFPAVVTSVVMTAVKVGGFAVALRGWIKSCKDVRWHKELRYGFKDNCRGWKVQDKKKSLFYRNSVFIFCFVMFSNAMEAIFQYRYREALELSSFAGSLHVSAVSRLFLVSSLLFSLKLAAESDSFPSDVAWQTNWALAAWAGLVGIGQCVKFHPTLHLTLNRIEMLALSGLLFIKGLKIFRRDASSSADSALDAEDSAQESDDAGPKTNNDKE